MADGSAQVERISLLARSLRGITRVVALRPRVTLWLVLVLSCASIGATVSLISFRARRADLIDSDDVVQQRWEEYTSAFGEGSDIIVVVEASDTSTIRTVMDDVADRLRREPKLFGQVLHRVEAQKMQSKALQYLTAEELHAARSQLERFSPILMGNRWELVELASYARRLNREIKARVRNARNPEPVLREARLLTASINRFFRDTTNGFSVDRLTFRPPWSNPVRVDQYVSAQSSGPVYLMNDQKNMGFVKVFAVEQPGEVNCTEACIERLREHLVTVNAEYSETDESVRVSLTGIPVLEHDDMRRSQADMLKACLLAFGVVGGLLLIGFRGVRHPMLALLMLIVGMSWTFGLTTVVIGHLNVLSVSFAVILIGLGIDFSIHYLSRYLQLRQEGLGLIDALVETSGSVGTGIVTAALTTALAFACAVATDFVGIAELGIIAGAGIMLCAVATFVVLPALIRLSDAGIPAKRLPSPIQGNGLRRVINGWPTLVLVFSIAVVAGLISQAFDYSSGRPELKVRYDGNLLKLQAKDLESVAVRNRMAETSRDGLLYAVSLTDSWEDTIRLKRRLEELPTVARVEEMASRIPSEPSHQERGLITALRKDLSGLPKRVPNVFGSADPNTVGSALDDLYSTVNRLTGRSAEFTASGLDSFLDGFMELPLQSQVGFLNAYQNFMAGSLLGQFRNIAAATNLEPVRYEDLPQELTSRFLAKDEQGQQKWLLQIFPKEQVWDEEPLTRFVEDLRSVDPEVTGTPLQYYEASQSIRTSYQTAAMYALGIISLVLLLDFLKPGQKLLTLIPPIAIVAFVGYTLHQRSGEINPHLLVIIYLSMVAFIGAVLDFRNLRDVLLALLPPLLGGAMMIGALALLQVDLNPTNLIVLPLVLGIGVDDGVHVVHDYRRQMRDGQDVFHISASTLNAILLTSLTSMVGFGSLMISSHPGLFSVGMTLTIGVGCCMFVSLIPLPAILALVGSSFAEEATVPIPERLSDDELEEATKPKKRRAA